MLRKYGPVLAMGAAAGRDSRHHRRGYAYLFVGGDASYTPTYTYTWKQAVADGAGTNTYDPAARRRARDLAVPGAGQDVATGMRIGLRVSLGPR